MIKVEVYLECDKCGDTVNEDIKPDEKGEDVIDREGWELDFTSRGDRLLCQDCAEAADENI